MSIPFIDLKWFEPRFLERWQDKIGVMLYLFLHPIRRLIPPMYGVLQET